MKYGIPITAIILALALAACSSYRQFPMGDSVAEMTGAQTANPEGYQGKKEGLDANKAENALRVYRRDVSKPADIKDKMEFNQ